MTKIVGARNLFFFSRGRVIADGGDGVGGGRRVILHALRDPHTRSVMPALITSPNSKMAFRCKQILGRGVFGTVYLVESPGSVQYAMKVIQCRTASSAARSEAKQEVDILRSNSKGHHNIIRYMDSWFRGSDLCILMEYAPNGTLEDMLKLRMRRNKQFEEIEVTHFLRQLSSALGYCHAVLHVIHRDLKPANVMVDQFGVLKLGDFGVSKRITGTMAFAATQAGTPLYMAPEMVQGAKYSYAVDVWMLGCVLYELMVFYTPFSPPHDTASSIEELMQRVTSRPVSTSPLLARYPRELCQVVAWMLNKTPDTRPTMGDVTALFDIKPPPLEAVPDLASSAAQIQMAFRQSRTKKRYPASKPPPRAPPGVDDIVVGDALTPEIVVPIYAQAAANIQMALRKSFQRKQNVLALKAKAQIAAVKAWPPRAESHEEAASPVYAAPRRFMPLPPPVGTHTPRGVPGALKPRGVLPDLQLARISRLAEPRIPHSPAPPSGAAPRPSSRPNGPSRLDRGGRAAWVS